jgi:hypothetical protein
VVRGERGEGRRSRTTVNFLATTLRLLSGVAHDLVAFACSKRKPVLSFTVFTLDCHLAMPQQLSPHARRCRGGANITLMMR